MSECTHLPAWHWNRSCTKLSLIVPSGSSGNVLNWSCMCVRWFWCRVAIVIVQIVMWLYCSLPRSLLWLERCKDWKWSIISSFALLFTRIYAWEICNNAAVPLMTLCSDVWKFSVTRLAFARLQESKLWKSPSLERQRWDGSISWNVFLRLEL